MAINSGNTLIQAKISLAVEVKEGSSEHFVRRRCQGSICIYAFTHTGGRTIEEDAASSLNHVQTLYMHSPNTSDDLSAN